MKLIPLLIALTVSTAVTAKTTTLLCETKPNSVQGTNRGPGNQIKLQNDSVSVWNVILESDQSGSITAVILDDSTKKFSQKGELVTFQAAVFSSLEINAQTRKARITYTGYDTAEQGNCKELSVTGVPVLPTSTVPAAVVAAAEPAPVHLTTKEQKAVVINEVQITDTEKYKEYVSKVQALLPIFGGLFIVKGENSAALDGSKSGGSVAIIQFPNRTKALQWYVSDDYQKLLKNTNIVSITHVYSAE
jgi:uncharacterized protein (DUF1330 family)